MPSYRQTLYQESTYTLEGTFTEDALPYDLTGATVTVILRRPDDTEVTLSASAASPATGGVAECQIDTTDLDQEGVWHRCWRVVKGGDDRRSGPTAFLVTTSP